MHILITGATGFVGSALVEALQETDHDLILLSRSAHKSVDKQIRWIRRSELTDRAVREDLAAVEVVVHLAGYPISNKRTNANKEKMYTSRVDRLEQVMDAIGDNCHTLISASATGRFPTDRYTLYTENSTTPANPQGFMQTLCKHWEETAHRLAGSDRRCVIVRFGNILGDGGLLQEFSLFKWIFCTIGFGDGQNWFSWIEIDDLVRLLIRSIEDERVAGVLHAVSSHPVTWNVFFQELRDQRNIPFHLQLPAWVARLLFGERADLFLGSRNVTSVRLPEMGFSFAYRTIGQALEKKS